MNDQIVKVFLNSASGKTAATRLRNSSNTPVALLREVYAQVLPALHGVVTEERYGFHPGWKFTAKCFYGDLAWRRRSWSERVSIGLVLSFLVRIGMVPLELHPRYAQTGTRVYRVCLPSGWVWPEL